MKEYLVKSQSIYTGDDVIDGYIHITGNLISGVIPINETPPEGVSIHNVGSSMVLPGLWDVHIHALLTGLSLSWVDLSKCTSIREIQEELAQSADGSDAPIIGAKCDDSKLDERRMPDMADLDAVTTSQPIIINRIDSHSMVLNRVAYDLYSVDVRWDGTEVDDNGKPTGRVVANANEKVREKMFRAFTPEYRGDAYRRAADLAAAKGCTDLCALEGGELFGSLEGGELSGTEDARILLSILDELPVEYVIYNQFPTIAGVLEMGLKQIGGCILVDGSIGSRTAAISAPYNDNPYDKANCGELYLTQEFLDGFVREASDAGLQVALHAIGCRAVKSVLDAFATVGTLAGDLRHRVEHAELISDEDITRAADMGVVISMQPAFEYYWGGPGKMYEDRLGERYKISNRLRPIVEAGAVVAGGSDSNITPLNPLLGIHSAVNHPVTENAVDINTAIKMFTANAAYACHQENEKGTIAPGFQANLTIIEEDLLDVAPEQIKDVKVMGIVVGGELNKV